MVALSRWSAAVATARLGWMGRAKHLETFAAAGVRAAALIAVALALDERRSLTHAKRNFQPRQIDGWQWQGRASLFYLIRGRVSFIKQTM